LDFNWWVDFTKRFSAVVAKDSKQGCKIALRDHQEIKRIKRNLTGLWYDAAAACFQEDGGDWCAPKETAGTIKAIRNRLRKADEAGLEWFQRKGRVSNFYTDWLAQIDPATAEHDWGKGTEIDENWLKEMRRSYLVGPHCDDEEMRLNELAWCLSRQGRYPYEFRIIGLRHNLEDWRGHFDRWWPSIQENIPRIR
jgi:hypothetical protein